MRILKNVLPIIAVGLVLSGCASNKHSKPAQQTVSPQIVYAPAIDVSYEQVTSNINQSIGTNVRWGGQVIETVAIDDSTIRLTVFAHPLSNEGRPITAGQVKQKSGRFYVDLKDGFTEQADFNGHFVTFYGDITSGQVVTNGNLQKTIPVINAQELVDWNIIDDSRRYAQDRRGNSYYSLGYRTGHFGYPYYGFSRFGLSTRYASFGYFSRGGSRFGRRGFGRSSFGRRGFGRSSFGGRGFSRRGFGGFRRH